MTVTTYRAVRWMCANDVTYLDLVRCAVSSYTSPRRKDLVFDLPGFEDMGKPIKMEVAITLRPAAPDARVTRLSQDVEF